MKNLKRLQALLLILCLMLPTLASAEVTYPWSSDKPVELTYWTPIASNAIAYISSYNENEAIQEIKSRYFGCYIDTILIISAYQGIITAKTALLRAAQHVIRLFPAKN